MEKTPSRKENSPKPLNLPFDPPEQKDNRTDEELRTSILEKRKSGIPLDRREAEIHQRDLEESWEDNKGGLYGQSH